MSEKEVLTGEADILLVCLASSETPAAKTQIGVCRFMYWRCQGSSQNKLLLYRSINAVCRYFI